MLKLAATPKHGLTASHAPRTAPFGQCRERAQNECPAWSGAPEDVIERCLATMFAEGPGAGPAHGHYNNMTDRKYRGVACGIAQMPGGELWVVQNFYPRVAAGAHPRSTRCT